MGAGSRGGVGDALRDAHDGIIGYLLIVHDNTARKQAEEALLKAGALQSAIFHSANFRASRPTPRASSDLHVGAERMLGYTAADVVDKITPADISDPQEVIAARDSPQRRARHPIAPRFEPWSSKPRAESKISTS